ncbi:MAG TPA: 16S rRNA (adenine(1518)-N(6)/adenine(1519)-N(6))-dimethyltransferase RsmA [Bacteroidales bacterium]|jgi:16S rRNA (adenine1518-N6/adenine1519-N6)-dimethyltransferase|nr:16S rRNA (adenine(1518)-N(6)/adenine(1519)-N(6))-dimethyltransferase RsmA [Bacteroidales bacterium]MDI9572971.1 16S rRNA (adenine(1518)-N(6)/adenine(1519)-N(6))-dimethyltransferase RsmA [Bacteroidota bacterium]OQC58624.1 MAG: Ribosomal RNA small subunit methyltransferase A [Bacteroidetes bacterium ADurb.Bin012]MBP9512493.1 16S rRNA (adenine(1518)-N(6)/adenine(1519)-N(6))-dimethyltransferase RsmA [Bacteroidales bacterium]MBP9589254.1 16S rRNA (adenine(1518)-N(6)/adenine(1519)-N(6))-dimethyltr
MSKQDYNSQKVSPKKFLGQHFLHDKNIARKIVESLSLQTHNILEIGPGMGMLTQYLLQKPNINLKLVEIDNESVVYLKERFPQIAENIIFSDFLQLDIHSIFNEPFAIIGNFPYNISSQILFKVYEHVEMITELSGMFQAEVARRIISGPGNKDYGILSVLIQTFYDGKYLFTVNENVFTPPPSVKSGVIHLKRNPGKHLPCPLEDFTLLVKTAFNQRRKVLRNALSRFQFNFDAHVEVLLQKRAEQLNSQDFIYLTCSLQKFQ